MILSALRFHQADSERLREMLLEAAQRDKAKLVVRDDYGQRYQLDFAVVRPRGLVSIRTAWIVLAVDVNPCLTTCYVLSS